MPVLLVSNLCSSPCSQLFQANHSVFGSSQGSSMEDLFTDSIDSCDLDITEKVQTFDILEFVEIIMLLVIMVCLF